MSETIISLWINPLTAGSLVKKHLCEKVTNFHFVLWQLKDKYVKSKHYIDNNYKEKTLSKKNACILSYYFI